jgi:hypothetical protein
VDACVNKNTKILLGLFISVILLPKLSPWFIVGHLAATGSLPMIYGDFLPPH